jgi:hypothetical protein
MYRGGQKPKLLDQVRQAIRARHYNLRTEKAYVQWIKRFILFHNKRHSKEAETHRLDRYRRSVEASACEYGPRHVAWNLGIDSILI